MATTVLYQHRTGLGSGLPPTHMAGAFVTGPRQMLCGVVKIAAVSYATGGIAADLQGGMGSVDMVQLTATGGYVAEYDATNKKVKLYSAPGTEVTATTSVTCDVHFFCIGSR